ncbi:MAG: DUF2177 family protein [Pseudomonadota bacterium]
MQDTAPTSFSTHALAYLAALVTIAVLDGLWLGFVAKDLYKTEMGALMNDSPRIVPAALFYLMYPAGLVFLLATAGTPTLGGMVLRAAVIGLLAYGAYDATNLAVIRGFSVKLSLIDLGWGVFLTGAAGASVFFTLAARGR